MSNLVGSVTVNDNFISEYIQIDGKNIWVKNKNCWTNIITNNEIVLFKGKYDKLCFYKDTVIFNCHNGIYSWNMHTRRKVKLIGHPKELGKINLIDDMRIEYGILYYTIMIFRSTKILTKFNFETHKLKQMYLDMNGSYRSSYNFKVFHDTIYHLKCEPPDSVNLYMNGGETNYKNINSCCYNSKYCFCVIGIKLFQINLTNGTSINHTIIHHISMINYMDATENYLMLQLHRLSPTYVYNMKLQLVRMLNSNTRSDLTNNYYFSERVMPDPDKDIYKFNFYKLNNVILNTIKNKCRNNNYKHIIRLFNNS